MVCLSPLMAMKGVNLNVDFLQILTLYPTFLLPDDILIKFQQLGINIEIYFMNDLLSLWSNFFHWEAWLRIIDYLAGLLWFERMNKQLDIWTISYGGWLALISIL